MQDRLEEFLTNLANSMGADEFRAYSPDPADADLSGFRADLAAVDEYEADGLLYTGRTHTTPYLPLGPTNMIEVALTDVGVGRWRTPRRAKAGRL